MTPAEKAQVQLETKMECARIASLECRYWSEIDDHENLYLAGISMGGIGAAANICGALFMNKTEAQVRSEIGGRPKGIS